MPPDQNGGEIVGNLILHEQRVCNNRSSSDVVNFLPHVE